uniref:Sema domain-containing protein n=3 Tax=Parascaris univalens TaxID=6257 RepID=A0A915BHS0_PARUN
NAQMVLLVLASMLSVCMARNLIASTSLASPINAIAFTDSKIYVGSVNRLSILDISTLEPISDVITGPQLDSTLCNYDTSACLKDAKLSPTDYVTKILHLRGKTVLVCGSLHQGVCQVRSADTLSILANGSVPVAPNDANSSCVSVMDSDEVLFVASAYTNDSPYRESFPAVSSREPPYYNIINSGSIEGEAAVHIRTEYRTRFRLRYIGAFLHEDYAYFVSVQSKRLSSNVLANILISKLVRVCRGDHRYVSYSEIEVQCRGADNRNYNIVTSISLVDDTLLAAFTDQYGGRSAICIYPMQKIRLTFWYNIDRCRVGTDTVGLPHIGRDTKCLNKSHLPLSEDTCAMGVGGNIECDQIAVYHSDSNIRSLAATRIDNITVIAAGTDEGKLLQLRVKGSSVEQYEELQLSVDPITTIRFINNGSYVAIANHKILRLSVSDCESYSTCTECTQSKDGLCGWCLFEGVCALRPHCGSLLVAQCPTSQLPVPSNVSIDVRQVSIFVPVGNYPIPTETHFVCTFGERMSSGEWSGTGVRCLLPDASWEMLDVDHTSIQIRLSSSPNSPSIIAQEFIIYDCSKHITCSACSSSRWGCKWCTNSGACFPKHAHCEEQPAFECPRIDLLANSELLIADQANISISLPVLHIHKDSTHDNLSCQIDIDGEAIIMLNARFISDKVICDQRSFSFQEAKPQKLAKLHLLRGPSLIDTTNVTLYKCAQMASECSACLSLDPKWSCTWCGNSCSFTSHCTSPPSSNSADLLCGQPVIDSFKPRSGPLEGGTRIEIRGRELGLSLSDVRDRVFVGGTKCEVLDYEVSSKIVCAVGPGSGANAIQLRLGQSGRRFVDSSSMFQFVDPQPKSVFPTFGPLSGGTRLAIYGANLNVGSNTTILIGTYPCKMLHENELHAAIVCVTSRSEKPISVESIRIQIDRSVRILERKFEYRRDPVIYSIFPTATFESGGRLITVEGENLDSVLAPKMFIASTSGSKEESISALGDCKVQNGTRMVCLSPRSLLPPSFSPSTYSRWPVGFVMDNVQSVRNLGVRVQITVVPDPQFVPFKGVRIHRPDQLFLIEGNYLSHAATAADYQVYIGSSRCVVTLLDTRQLMCRAPPSEPAPTDEKGNPIGGSRPLLTVVIGSLRHELGLVEYETSAVRLSLAKLVAVLCAAIAVCTLASILACILYRRKKDEREKDYKRIQLKMEYLEFNVRNECKQAFAELQTDVTDLTTAVDGHGIPFHEKAEFISRLLFRDITPNTALLTTASLYSSHLAIALAQFDSLLWNKRFIIAIADMADGDTSFSIDEKKLVSSLLMGSLLGNIAYCSDVVLSLLTRHITNAIQKRTAHLVFRQSGSVVEKLFSLWFSICLFEDIRGTLGSPLFLLYKALKCQIEKGPVDAITGNARYSLSEHKLLREPIDASPIQVLVVPLEDFDQSPILVRALTSDTISQLKMKLLDAIYKNEPFSMRITAEQFDLEWRCPRRGSMLLSDDDGMLFKTNRKLNCISDYGITNNALLSMQPALSRTYADTSTQSTNTGCQMATANRTLHYYHLESSPEKGAALSKLDQSIPKSIPEVFLTRLLTSKGTVQKFVDDFIDSVLFTTQNDFPVVLKYVFELFDEIATRNNFTDTAVIRAWKTNAWILRFWVNVISNVDFLLDVQRTPAVDASLAVVAQTLVDAFSISRPTLGKESPSSKLLFAKDIERYRSTVGVFFRRIKAAPNISAKQFFEHVASLSNNRGEPVSGRGVTSELLAWVRGNGLRLVEVLSADPCSRQHRLADRLQQIIHCSVVEPEHIYATLQ